MNRINTELVIDLINSNISEVRGLIGNLLDYSDHISVIEEKRKKRAFGSFYNGAAGATFSKLRSGMVYNYRANDVMSFALFYSQYLYTLFVHVQ